jgi:hypothetical protein
MELQSYFKQLSTPAADSPVGILMLRAWRKNAAISFVKARAEANRLLERAATRTKYTIPRVLSAEEQARERIWAPLDGSCEVRSVSELRPSRTSFCRPFSSCSFAVWRQNQDYRARLCPTRQSSVLKHLGGPRQVLVRGKNPQTTGIVEFVLSVGAWRH